jgi:hypothetical protein
MVRIFGHSDWLFREGFLILEYTRYAPYRGVKDVKIFQAGAERRHRCHREAAQGTFP